MRQSWLLRKCVFPFTVAPVADIWSVKLKEGRKENVFQEWMNCLCHQGLEIPVLSICAAEFLLDVNILEMCQICRSHVSFKQAQRFKIRADRSDLSCKGHYENYMIVGRILLALSRPWQKELIQQLIKIRKYSFVKAKNRYRYSLISNLVFLISLSSPFEKGNVEHLSTNS